MGAESVERAAGESSRRGADGTVRDKVAGSPRLCRGLEQRLYLNRSANRRRSRGLLGCGGLRWMAVCGIPCKMIKTPYDES